MGFLPPLVLGDVVVFYPVVADEIAPFFAGGDPAPLPTRGSAVDSGRHSSFPARMISAAHSVAAAVASFLDPRASIPLAGVFCRVSEWGIQKGILKYGG